MRPCLDHVKEGSPEKQKGWEEMIQTIIQNNNTGQTAVADLPQSRMNMAGMLASIGIRQPAYDVHGDDPFGKELTGISSDPYGSHPAVYMRRERKAPTSGR